MLTASGHAEEGPPQASAEPLRSQGQPLTPGQPHLDGLQCAQQAANTSLNILSEQENHLTTSLPEE